MAEASDVIEEQQNVEELVEAVYTQSDYDSVYAAIARKSERRAQLLDENLSIAKAVKKVMIGIEIFASEHGCKPDDLDVTAKMTIEGRIVITLRRA
jgi:hypothetical protein